MTDIAQVAFPHLPAAIGVMLAFVLNPPKTHVGTAGLLIGSFGCAKVLGPALFAAMPSLTGVGSELIMGALGVLIFQTVAAGLRKLDAGEIMSSWLRKGK